MPGFLRHARRIVAGRSRFEDEMREELRLHLEQRTEALVAEGLTRENARRRARIEFSGIESYKEQCRDAVGSLPWRVTHGLWGDLRLAMRRLWATPLFVLFAVLSLGLGLGVTTAVYSLLHSLLWQAPGVRDPDRLMFLTVGGQTSPSAVSRLDFDDLRAAQRSFAALGAASSLQESLVGGRASEIMDVEAVTGNYFQTVGVDAALGRTIQPADDQHGAAVIVLSHRVWRARFDADPGVIGRTVRLGGHPFEVIGVARRSFDGLSATAGLRTAVWIPLGAVALFDARTASDAANRERPRLAVVGRLAEGRTPQSAAAELAAVGSRLDAAFPRWGTDVRGGRSSVERRAWSGRLVTARDPGAPDSRVGLLIVVVVGLVLLVACTNLANLMLARGTIRQRELAVRSALGASRWRLVRDACAESVIVAALGGAAAFMVTRWLLVAFTIEVPTARGAFYLEPELNLSALLFASCALVLSLLVFGVEPALQLTKSRVSASLGHESGDVASRTSRQRALLRWQVAVSVCFFLLAAVLGRVIVAEARHDPGIELDRLALATVYFQPQRWDESRARRTLEASLAIARGTPGIQAVAAASGAPFGMTMTPFATVTTPGKPAVAGQEREGSYVLVATPGIFNTLGVPITHGRAFDERDQASSPAVAVASERTARALFGTVDAIGRQVTLEFWGRPPSETFAIIGIARDTDSGRMMSRSSNTLYVPFAQHYEPSMAIIARTSGNPAAAAQALQTAVRRADPGLGVGTAGAAALLLAGPFLMARLLGTVAAALGALTLLLAMIGLYGVLAQAVAHRTHEMGVRLSLGASQTQIEWLVLRQGLRPVLEGIAFGMIFGVVARLAIRAILVAPIAALDPIAFGVVPIPLCAIAFLACYLPARRAARVDPNAVLRHL